MAIVNATPDSFSDGGRWSNPEALSELRCVLREWAERGVEVFDVGAESTRPGATPISEDEEWSRLERLLPEVCAATPEIIVSVDTRHAQVAKLSLEAGARVINDVTGFADPEILDVVSRYRAGVIIGHLRGELATMQTGIAFSDVVSEVADELLIRVEQAKRVGVEPDQIYVDPGIGFGKTTEHCLALLVASRWIEERTGCGVAIGASRKRFLGDVTGRSVKERTSASVAAALLAAQSGAALLRIHDVDETMDALAVLQAVASYVGRDGKGSLQC